MAKKPIYRRFFSQGQNRRYRFNQDDFNPFLNLVDDIEDFEEKWKKSKVNAFLYFGDFTIDLELIKKAYPGTRTILQGGSIRERNLPDIVKLRDALKSVERILKDKEAMREIAKKAYIKVVPKELDKYLTHKNARHIVSVIPASEAEGEKPGITKKYARKFWKVSKRGQYTKKWEKVVDIILDGINGKTKWLKERGTGVESFSLNDLKTIEIERSKSKYRSVFMMEEFGTGQFVQGQKRTYMGKGQTFFKVPPYIIQAVNRRLKKGPKLTNATAAWYITKGALAYGEGQYAAYMKLKNDPKKKGLAERALSNLARNIENWTYGYAEDHHKGREPLNLFFEKGGLAKTIRDIQLKAQEEVIKQLNIEIKKVAPEFPGITAILVSRS